MGMPSLMDELSPVPSRDERKTRTGALAKRRVYHHQRAAIAVFLGVAEGRIDSYGWTFSSASFILFRDRPTVKRYRTRLGKWTVLMGGRGICKLGSG
jgi:hypothetical protein